MIGAQDVIEPLTAWLAATAGIDAGSTYDFLPGGKEKALPDVVVDLASEAITHTDPAFDFVVQQTDLHVMRFGASFMVEAGAREDDPTARDTADRAATLQLREFGRRIMQALLADVTCDGTLPGNGTTFLSPRVAVDYTPPLVQYEDGTFGREMTLQVSAANLTEVAIQ